MSGEKKSGKNTGREKESRGKSGKNLVTCKKFSHFSLTIMWVRDDKCGSLLANTEDLAYMGVPLIILTASFTLDVDMGDQDLSQTSSVLTVKGYLNK